VGRTDQRAFTRRSNVGRCEPNAVWQTVCRPANVQLISMLSTQDQRCGSARSSWQSDEMFARIVLPAGSLCTASAEQIFPRDSVQRNYFELALYTARDHDCISNRIGSGIRSAMQISSRYVRSAPNAVDDRTDHHADRSSTSGPSSSVPSIAGTAMQLAPAPYRASGLVL
jgi:hypothetical protein